MRITDPGARAVWPKTLKCRNCGSQVIVDSMADLAQSLPGFTWIANAPAAFQFGCPNACGSAYIAINPDARQAFHHAPCVLYGGADPTTIGVGRLVPAVKRRRQRHRRMGEGHGPVS